MRDILDRLDGINLLMEGPKQDFKQLFQNIEMPDYVRSDVQKNFTWAYETFQKNGKPNGEQILWYMRYIRIWALYEIVRKTDNPSAQETYQTVLDKEASRIGNKASVGANDVMHDARTIATADYSFRNRIEHYRSLGIEQINDLMFGWKTSGQILEEMEEIEDRWKETRRRYVEPAGDEEMIMKFPDGTAWFNLGRGSCSIEGEAMGHCGNVPSERGGDQILSLRKIVKQGSNTFHVPQLTFILDGNGELGEMKGFANEKPGEEFHDHIVALLNHDQIEGIKGGGYMPQSNFSLYDLEDETRDELLAKKPRLRGLVDKLRAKKWEDIDENDLSDLEDKMREYDIAPYDISFPEKKGKDDAVVLENFSSAEQLANDKFHHKHPVHELIKIYEDEDELYEYLDFTADDVGEEAYIEIIRNLRRDIQDRIYSETSTDNAESALWKLQGESHPYYEMLQDAIEEGISLNVQTKDENQLELTFEAAGSGAKTIKDTLRERIVKYIQYTSINPFNAYFEFSNKDDLDATIELRCDIDSLLNALEQAQMDDNGDGYEDYGFEGDLWAIRENGWGYEEQHHEYSEQFGKDAYNEELRMINDDDEDLFLAELKDSNVRVDVAKAIDHFERAFRMSESVEYDDELESLKKLLK